MSHEFRFLPMLALALAGASAAHAQRIAPGLWEQSTHMKSGSGQMEGAMAQMQREMAQMPPEQRKQMQDMMARQGMGMSGQANTMRVCISKEQAERQELGKPEPGCTYDAVQRSGNTVKMKFNCPGKGSGDAEYTMAGDKSYRGRSVVTTTVDGKPERMEMTMSAKWLSADCGNVKPLQ
jgi:hypothetical protein